MCVCVWFFWPVVTFSGQVALLDQYDFMKVHPDELEGLAWTRADRAHRAPSVMNITRRFNDLSFWISLDILLQVDETERAARLAQAITLCDELLKLRDFQGAFAVMSSLQRSAIFRMNNTWTQLSDECIVTFEECETVLSQEDNFKNAREVMTAVSGPCVPFLGIYFADLVYIRESGTNVAVRVCRIPKAQSTQ